MSRTLYVSDLDGTLLGADSQVSAESKILLRRVIESGGIFTVATARTPATVSGLLAGIELPAPAIVMTGSVLWDQRSGTYTDPCFLSPEAVDSIKRIYERLGVPPFTYTLGVDGRLHIYHPTHIDTAEMDFIEHRSGTPFKEFHITDSLPAEARERTLLMYAMQPTALNRAACDALMQDCPDVTPVYYHDIFGPDIAILEVFAAGASKAAAAREVARRNGCDRIVAFGDNINDLPLLQAADVAVAVENAVPEVKAAAHVVIGRNTESSVARYIAAECGV